jgi:hypothetical protein
MKPLLGRYLLLVLAAVPVGLAGYAIPDWRLRAVELSAPSIKPMMPLPAVSLVGPARNLRVYTDRGNPVNILAYPEQPPPSPEVFAAEDRWLHESRLSSSLTPTAPPTASYVCHDWVFTGGHYALLQPSLVPMILEDNGYREISVPQAGDLAVYLHEQHRCLMHTGIVHSIAEDGTVQVESKWAWMGRYIHPASVYIHPQAVCLFYRSTRSGHLLRGLDRPEPADSEPVPVLAPVGSGAT